MINLDIRANRKKLLLFLILLFVGCTATKSLNYIPFEFKGSNLNIIAKDISNIVNEYNPIKDTTFIVADDNFGNVLYDELRKYGYSVVIQRDEENKYENGLKLIYILDWVDDKSMYLSLTVDNNQRYIRCYNIDNGTIITKKIKVIGTVDD